MRRLHVILLVALVLLAGVHWASAEETSGDSSPAVASDEEAPHWAIVTLEVLVAGGIGVILVSGTLWALRGRLLEQVRPNFTPWGIVEVFLLGFIWYLLKVMPLSFFVEDGKIALGDIPMWYRLGCDVLAGVVLIVMTLWVMRRRYGVTAESLGFRRGNVLLAVALALLALMAVTAIHTLLGLILKALNVEVRQVVVELIKQQSGLDLALSAMMAILVAPVVEEFLFRGVIQMGLRRYIGPWGAIGVGGAAFAIVHQPWAVSLYIFPLGLMLGYLYQRRQSLVAPIALHMFFNSLSIAVVISKQLS